MEDKENVIGSLAHWVAAGKLESGVVLQGIELLDGKGRQPKTLLSLLESIDAERDEGLRTIAGHLRETLRSQALRVYERKREGWVAEPDEAILSGLCLDVAGEWNFAGDPTGLVDAAARTAHDLGFLSSKQDKAPQLFRAVKLSMSQALAAAHESISGPFQRATSSVLKQLADAWPSDMPGRDQTLGDLGRQLTKSGQARLRSVKAAPAGWNPFALEDDDSALATLQAEFATAETREQKTTILDRVCSWRTPACVPFLGAICAEAWSQSRSLLNLTMRFGQPGLLTWEHWQTWLSNQASLWRAEQQTLSRLIQQQPAGLLLIAYSQVPEPDSAVVDTLAKAIYDSGPPMEVQALIDAWSKLVPITERRALLGVPEPEAGLIPPLISEVEAGRVVHAHALPPPLPRSISAEIEPAPRVPAGPPAPPKPSIWENHIQPLFVENWYIVAGIAMVILGSSLLAYYTWDKHWLVRYTIMPALLAIFTWSLAGVGSWIEKQSAEFKGTAAILRTAAIGLLPINFMAMALLSADEKVPQKAAAMLVMAAIYLSVFGWGLRKWCGAVEPSLRNGLAGTLLLLNALVGVGPLARTVGGFAQHHVLICLGAGFYLGFFVAVYTTVHFMRRILTRKMADEKRVPWFVAGALAITYVQVFVWVHGFMRHLPHAHTYALLIISVGWLILYSEKRALALRETPQMHGGESFLGFAFILLGLLMGFSEPTVRIACFIAAGLVWMYQAFSRRHPLHYWIALTLLGLGGASAGLLPQFPGPWLPSLGLALALGFGLGGWASEKWKHSELTLACRGMQAVSLFLTTIVAPLVQWHYRSAPLMTGGWLLLVAAFFGWRSFKDQKIHWLHATMLVLALALPYAGSVDMTALTAHHNTMVFGLAILSYLWLGLTWLRPTPLILQARSTVLWFYGSLAVAAMVLRVALGDTAPDPLWYRDYMDYAGPFLMTLALIPATYFSRSLVPAGMGVVIMVILFPELRANLQRTLTWMHWGSGLTSSILGLALCWACFFLRKWAFLKDLPEGDRFMGKELFPLRRNDHTLFTWPILAAVLFLLIKVDTWNLVRNLSGYGVPLKTVIVSGYGVQLKTASALGITAIAWTFLGIYRRDRRGAVVCVHLGWLWMLAGLHFGYWGQAHDPHWTWPFLILGLLLQGLFWLYRFGLEEKYPWAKALLTEPMRLVLSAGSAGLAIVCVACLFSGTMLARMELLYLFLGAQMICHGLAIRNRTFGTILFFQIWVALLASTAPGEAPLLDRVSVDLSLAPTLWLLVGIQLLLLVLEGTRAPHKHGAAEESEGSRLPFYPRVAPLVIPSFILGSFITIILGLAGTMDGVHWLTLSGVHQVLLLCALLLTARAHASGFVLLMGMLFGYLMVHRDLLVLTNGLEAQIELLTSPWRLAVFGMGMVLLTQAGRWVYRRKKELIAGPFAQPFFTAPSCAWTFWPAAIISALAALYHTFSPGLRESTVQLWAPYLGAVTFGLVAWFWRRSRFFAGVGFLLLLGNIHLVRVFGGDWLRGQKLSELHLICLGISLTLLQASVLRRVLRNGRAIVAINLASLGLACSILVLLSANYFTEPDLTRITRLRFIISGTMALLAGLYFRRAARHPGPGEEAHVDLCEALYHFGVVLAIWCAALLVPWFQDPLFALVALGLPAAYFYARAEVEIRAAAAAGRRYRNSATVLGFVVLGLYLFKGVFHMVLFPGTTIPTGHYHYNAPLIMVLGLLLLRLHGLGGTSWLAFYGGLALMTGSYFLLTWLPGLSPFGKRMPSAWCAIGLGHFWILLSYSRSPLRTLIQRLARLEDPAWHSLRHWWGLFLLAATHGATAWGLTEFTSDTLMVAPLLAGVATILIHQGIIRRRLEAVGSHATSSGYLIIAAVEFTWALHMDFLIHSYLPKDQVIWALLLIWLALLAVYQVFKRKIELQTVGRIAIVLGALVIAQILYLHPWSDAGLWGMGLAAILAAWNPQRTRQASNAMERICSVVLLFVPTWLIFFSQAPLENHQLDGGIEVWSWSILATTLALFLTGVFARLFPAYLAAGYEASPRSGFRLFDSTLTLLQSVGARIHQVTLWLTLLIVATLQVLHYQTPFAPREIVLLVLMEAALAVGWWHEGKGRGSMLAYYLMQIAAVACFASIRRQLMLAMHDWNYEYDVWASLGVSLALGGAKQVFDLQPRSLRVPLLTTMLLLPPMALVWVLVHHLGVNMALLVVGLHSVTFAYLGKDDRESPYNIVALAGFVAFILVTFYSKFHLRAVHAYIIPTGLGVLILQEIFRKGTRPEAKNWIRLVTLMAMLGSSGYYALADSSHPISFNFTMIILCLLSMALGSFLRIRLYLAIGFAGLMVDLISILFKVLLHMERSGRMTVIGSLVLTIGAVLVFGAIYYKTNKAVLDAWVDRWRGKLAQWQ